MSVHGEYERVLSDCVDFLREVDPPNAARIAKLESTAREGRHDLVSGARSLLGWLEAEASLPGASELQREEFARRTDHLSAICRAIAGGA